MILKLVRPAAAGKGSDDYNDPDSKAHGANMGPCWGWQDPGGLHVGPMNFVIWDVMS